MEREDISVQMYIVILYIVTAASCGFTIVSLKRPNAGKIFCVIAIVMFVSAPGTVGDARYRVPAMPLVCILASSGFILWCKVGYED